MRKLALAAAALGLLGATSLTPVYAASTDAGYATDLSSAGKASKKKMKRSKAKGGMSALVSDDLSAARKSSKKKMKRSKMKGGMSALVSDDLSAARKSSKKKMKRSGKKGGMSSVITYRIAA